jgi:hypothetical protein
MLQNHEAAQRLALLQSQNGQISIEDKQRIEKEYDNNIKLWKSRKKLVSMEMQEIIYGDCCPLLT